MSFKDKVVWITGASSGIGEALVKQFAAEGANVILSARNKAELERVKKESGLKDGQSLIISFDLQDTSGANSYAKHIIEKFGRIDILINNGGFSQRAEAIDTDMQTCRQLLEVNFFASVALTKAVLPYMLKQKSGTVVAMSSIAGKFGYYLRSSYSAAKHALHGYFESFRLETERQGIKTLIVCPGKIATSISVKAAGPNGTAHARMDESHIGVMSAEECARIILRGIQEEREELLVGGKELKAVWLKRFLPSLFGKIIRKQRPG